MATIPASLLPSTSTAIGEDELRSGGGIFSSRLQFISRYAEFHEMFARGEKRDAARFLVVMLSAKIVPKWWWGVILLDAGGMLDGAMTLFTFESLKLTRPCLSRH